MDIVNFLLMLFSLGYFGRRLSRIEAKLKDLDDSVEVTRARILSKIEGFLCVFRKSKEL